MLGSLPGNGSVKHGQGFIPSSQAQLSFRWFVATRASLIEHAPPCQETRLAKLRLLQAVQRGDAVTPVSKYQHGEYVRIEMGTGGAQARSIWMRVERCDDKRAIVYGTIDDETSQKFGKALRSGAKLGASYRQVREIRATLNWPAVMRSDR